MKSLAKLLVAGTFLAAVASVGIAATKDIVIDRVAAPIANPGAPAAGSDAMVVSVLVESPDGTLAPRSTDSLFATGERFRVKLLGSRDAKVSLYNTNPRGELSQEPIWRGDLRVGLETITPRLRLDGNSGVDYLHIVMEPVQETRVVSWLGAWLVASKDGGAPKDINLDVQNTPSSTYLMSAAGKGLVSTMRIVHR